MKNSDLKNLYNFKSKAVYVKIISTDNPKEYPVRAGLYGRVVNRFINDKFEVSAQDYSTYKIDLNHLQVVTEQEYFMNEKILKAVNNNDKFINLLQEITNTAFDSRMSEHDRLQIIMGKGAKFEKTLKEINEFDTIDQGVIRHDRKK